MRRGRARRAVAKRRTEITDAYGSARERFGGKTTIGLFLLSVVVTGMGVAPLLYKIHSSSRIDIAAVLGALFATLLAWMTVLLYRGAHLADDYGPKVAEGSPAEFAMSSAGDNLEVSGEGGCAGVVLDLVLGLVITLVLSTIFSIAAWIAAEIVFPLLVLIVYGTLYHALALAVNTSVSLKGRLVASCVRAVGFSALYTAVVGAIVAVAVAAFRVKMGDVR
jgi:hypothetical protein